MTMDSSCGRTESSTYLTHVPQEVRQMSFFGSCVLTTKINWGIGMMAMPFYMHAAGLWAGLAFFILSMALAADSAICVVWLRKTMGISESSYAGLMRQSLGRKGELAAVLSLIIANWGSTIAWTKFIGDNMARFLGLSTNIWVSLLCLPLLLCSWLEDAKQLERVSIVGLVAAQAFVLLLLACAVPHFEELPAYFHDEPVIRWQTFPVAMGLAVFCNEGMVIMAPLVAANMRRPDQYAASAAVSASYFLANYMMIGICGDFLYSYLTGSTVAQEVTLSAAFDRTWLHIVAVLAYSLQLLMTFPSVYLTVFVSIESILGTEARVGLKRGLRIALILLGCGISMLIPRFGDFLAVAGAIGNSMGIYILPHAALLYQSSKGRLKIRASRKVFSTIVLVLFGVLLGLIAAAVSLQQLFEASPSGK